jgi:urease accessory protein
LEIKVDTQCHLVLLTQGNTKVFKDRPGGSYGGPSATVTSANSSEASTSGTCKPITSSSRTHQRMRATIQPNASLLLLPAPVACFKDASYSQHQTFNLEDPTTSSLLLLDWFTSGRQSRGEKWHFERYRSRNEIKVAGRVIVNDVLLLEGTDFASRMGNYACYCNLFISGLPMKPILEHFKKLSDETIQYNRVQPEDLIWSFSELEKDHTAVVRCAGVETEMIKEWLAKHLFTLQALVGRDIYKATFV